MSMTPEHIKAARKEGFVLADFGDGFIPAVWSPFTKYWLVAEPREDHPIPGERLIARRFDTYPILKEKAMPMLAWIPIPTIGEIEKNRQVIKQLVDVLENAKEYVQAFYQEAYFLKREAKRDLDSIDAALAAGHDFLGHFNAI